MSHDNENKSEDINLGFHSDDNPENNGASPFASEEFNPFADGTFFPDQTGASDASNAMEDNTFPFPNDSLDASGAGQSLTDEISLAKPSDKNTAELSPFSMGADGNSTDSMDSDGETQADKDGKKGKKKAKAKKEKPVKKKKEKSKNEKKPGDGMGLPGGLSLVLGLLLLAALIAHNVFSILYPIDGVGFTSTICYLIGVDVFGLFAVAVPFMFFFNRDKKDAETTPDQKLDFFKVVLGTSVIAMSLGVILLLTAWYRYDFEIKPAQSLPPLSMPSSESTSAQ